MKRDPLYRSFRVFAALIGAVGAAAAVYPDGLPYGEFARPVAAFCGFMASGLAIGSKVKEGTGNADNQTAGTAK